jgi:hypothetical protein
MPAERLLIEACRNGHECKLYETRPAERGENNSVRADLVRFLALGGDDQAPVHEAGVLLSGAWILGQLDLTSCDVTRRLLLENCWFVEQIKADDARLPLLSLSGSLVPGFSGNRLKISGDLILRDGFLSQGEVCLVGSEIGGDLSCSNSKVINESGVALNAQSARIQGNAHLRAGFEAEGEVRLNAADIMGSLICNGGRFINPRRFAVTADGLRVAQYVHFSEKFQATGEVWLSGAQIGENFQCHDACFDNATGRALSAQRIRVDGMFSLRRVRMIGAVSLISSEVGGLVDDEQSWPPSRVKLDGFTYNRIVIGATTARARIAWLRKQKRRYLTSDFRPQPWEQLISVLRAMGHPNQAIMVAMAKQDALRRAGKIGSKRSRRQARRMRRPTTALQHALKGSSGLFWYVADGIPNLAHWLYGVLAGYGYRPSRIIWLMLAMWLACGFIAQQAHTDGLLEAARPEPQPIVADNPAPTQAQNSRPKPTFRPYWYSADLVLPVDLGQAESWTVAGPGPRVPKTASTAIQTLVMIITLAGWFFSLLFVAVVGNLVKKD